MAKLPAQSPRKLQKSATRKANTGEMYFSASIRFAGIGQKNTFLLCLRQITLKLTYNPKKTAYCALTGSLDGRGTGGAAGVEAAGADCWFLCWSRKVLLKDTGF